MKKTFTLLSSLLVGAALFGQVTITYQVDITNYLEDGNTLDPAGISIGGNFEDNGGDLPNWSPGDSPLTNVGGNLWSVEVTYPAAAVGETQLFKFINGNDWGMNEGNATLAECGEDDGFEGFNRTFVIPAEDEVVCFQWDLCEGCLLSTKNEAFTSFNVYPNPVEDVVTFSFESSVNGNASVQLMDLSGRVVATQQQNNNADVQMNVSSLAPGTYVYKVVIGEAVRSGKLTVK